jgi:hypothetical protein
LTPIKAAFAQSPIISFDIGGARWGALLQKFLVSNSKVIEGEMNHEKRQRR